MDELNKTSSLFSNVPVEEIDFVKLIIPVAAYEMDAKFFSDGWQPDNFILN